MVLGPTALYYSWMRFRLGTARGVQVSLHFR